MKWTGVICVVIALAVGYGLGRATRPQALEGELGSVDSFQRSLEETDWLTRSHLFSSFLMGLNSDNLPEALEVLEPQLQEIRASRQRIAHSNRSGSRALRAYNAQTPGLDLRCVVITTGFTNCVHTRSTRGRALSEVRHLVINPLSRGTRGFRSGRWAS